MAQGHYHSRASRRSAPAMTRLELTATVLTLVAIVALVVVFLVVYHDFPLRVA